MNLKSERNTILVVEDNLGDFVLLQDYLEEHEPVAIILRATNFVETKDIINNTSYNLDVILLDLSLPDKSGEELINEVMQLSGQIPVIVLTGYSDENFAVKSLSLGAADYMLKDELTALNIHKSILYSIERQKSLAKIKTSEKRYSDLFQFTPFPIFICNESSFQIIQANGTAYNIYGYYENEMLTMTFLDFFKNEYEKNKFISAIENNNRTTQFSDAKEYKHLTKNKSNIDVELIVSKVQLEFNKNYLTIMVNDITEKKQFEDKLTKAIINTQEEERFDIGSELHENVCQILAATKISLGMVKDELDGEKKEWVQQSIQYVDMANKEIRSISHRLAPAFYENINLEEACESLIKTFNPKAQFEVEYHFDKRIREIKLNRELQLNLYRILQEQLKNIVKYAKANKISLSFLIDDDEQLSMIIKDNGVGFDTSKQVKGIGLANMKRRAMLFQGDFSLQSSHDNGCEIVINIPLKENVKEKIEA